MRAPLHATAGTDSGAPTFPIQANNVKGVTDDLTDLIRAIDASTRPKKPEYEIEPKARATRRALLIGVQYKVWPKDSSSSWGPLPSTPYDVLRIYNMLRAQGYQESNFRILVEGIVSDHRCTPTKSHIMEGLQWLVQDAQHGDHRYFHFSGHGDAFETTKEVGKEARRIPRGHFVLRKDDFDRMGPNSDKTIERNKRITDQDAKEEELTYYNEAFVTTYLAPLHGITDPVEQENYNRVRDEELNAVFAELPKGCTITTTLDCCHSGRMINNNLKLLGSGFRGRLLGSSEETIAQGPLSQLPHDKSLNGVSVEDGKVLRDGTLDQRAIVIDILAPLGQKAPNITPQRKVDTDVERNASTTGPARVIRKALLENRIPPRNYVLPPRISPTEKLPANEASRDRIKATMMAWSSCHQRQSAISSNLLLGGYFTMAFTSAIMDLQSRGTPTVRELHEEVDKRLIEAIGTRRLQYTQLWTSLGDQNEERLRASLDYPFVV